MTNQPSIYIEEENEIAEIATAWINNSEGATVGYHKVFGGSFSGGDNKIESVQEIPGINGNTSFEISLEGSPSTVLTQHLDITHNGKIIDFYRSIKL
jgi:hypothetical protein